MCKGCHLFLCELADHLLIFALWLFLPHPIDPDSKWRWNLCSVGCGERAASTEFPWTWSWCPVPGSGPFWNRKYFCLWGMWQESHGLGYAVWSVHPVIWNPWFRYQQCQILPKWWCFCFWFRWCHGMLIQQPNLEEFCYFLSPIFLKDWVASTEDLPVCVPSCRNTIYSTVNILILIISNKIIKCIILLLIHNTYINTIYNAVGEI